MFYLDVGEWFFKNKIKSDNALHMNKYNTEYFYLASQNFLLIDRKGWNSTVYL